MVGPVVRTCKAIPVSLVEPMRSNHAHELRFGIDCLGMDTRRALLDAIGRETIIAGAYTDQQSICPSVIVHRRHAKAGERGGEDSLVGFARAWDAFTHARPGHPRVATSHELRVLTEMLEASVSAEKTRRERLRRILNAMAAPRRSAAVEPVEATIERPREPIGNGGPPGRRFARSERVTITN